MLARFAAFEIKYQLFSPVFILVGLVFFLLTYGSVTIDHPRPLPLEPPDAP